VEFENALDAIEAFKDLNKKEDPKVGRISLSFVPSPPKYQ